MQRERSPLTEAFGWALREARFHARLSQEQLAHRAGLDRSYISILERGQGSPSLRVLERLAEALGKPAHELVKAAEESAR